MLASINQKINCDAYYRKLFLSILNSQMAGYKSKIKL